MEKENKETLIEETIEIDPEETINVEETNDKKPLTKKEKKLKKKKELKPLTEEETKVGKKKCDKFNLIYFIAFIVINIANAFLIASPYVVENLLTYQYDIYMIFSTLVGNLSFLIMLMGIGKMIFKKHKSFNMYLMIVTGVLSFLLFGIGIFCNYYGMMFGFEALQNFGSDGGGDAFEFFVKSLPDVMKMSSPIFFLALLIMLVGYIVYVVKIKKQNFVEVNAPKRRVKLGLSVSLLGLFFLIFSTTIYNTGNKNTWYEYNANNLYSVQSNGFYSHYLTESFRQLFNIEKPLASDDREEAYKLIEEHKQGVPTNEFTNIFEDKNLLLIQMESINNFLIGLEVNIDGDWVEITPNMNKLVRENVYLDNFYTSVGIGNTSDAEFSVLTGLYPPGYTYTVFNYQGKLFETLPRLFEAKGYNTFSSHANTKKFYERENCHLGLYGFEEHYGKELFDEKRHIITDDNMVHEWLGDEKMLTETVDIMAEKNDENHNKSFAFTITISNHTPFNKPSNAISDDKWFKNKDNIIPKDLVLNKDHILNDLFKGYLEYVNYTDFAIGKAIERLKERGMYDDTVIMMYGDHGIVTKIYDMFYDYPELFRNDINPIIKKEYKHNDQKLVELQMLNEIPLIIANPSLKPLTIHNTRSEANLKSTISNLFGLNAQFNFNKDVFAKGPELCYGPKTELVYYDGLLVNTRHEKGVYLDKDCPYKVEDVIKEYQMKRDLNEKIINYDLLRKYLEK